MKNPLVIAVVAGASLIAIAILAGALLMRSLSAPSVAIPPEISKDLRTLERIAAGSEVMEQTRQLDLSHAKIDTESLRSFVNAHNLEENGLPESLSDLQSNPISKDPWGNAYNYVREEKTFRVWSSGPDGKSGTKDDIEPSK